jgi:uncharacterized membrane protein
MFLDVWYTGTVMKRLFKGLNPRYLPLVQALFFSNFVSLLLFAVRVFGAENFRFMFLFWNLLLAVVPLLFAAWLVKNLQRNRWLNWQNILLTICWLGFLPNSFYILTDLIHVHMTGEINILFDVVLFSSCIFNGFVFGYISLFLVHHELLKRMRDYWAHALIGAALFVSSFAIYLGRFLRWNSWDVLVHPFGLLFDITGRIINPVAHPQAPTTTLTFFLLLTSIYLVIYEFIALLRGQQR